MELSDKKFAVLIDADNISHRKIKDILDEIANYGTPTIKRIYGDFTDPKFAAWKSVLLENSITPIQQYAYTTGKNATDSALIIDAMDILHKESVNGFCIVSSDSDFTLKRSRSRSWMLKERYEEGTLAWEKTRPAAVTGSAITIADCTTAPVFP